MADNHIDPRAKATDDSREALVGRAANQFTEEVAQGNNPSISAYVERYPDVADVIRQVFPILRDAPVLESEMKSAELADPPGKGNRTLNPKQTLGDYELIREIGHGGMGVVYEARQISLDKRVALKVLPLAGVLDPTRLQRFRNEAKAAAQLQHPHIVPVHAVGCDRETHYYAMQYIDGSNLAEVIENLRQVHAKQSADESQLKSDQKVAADLAETTAPKGGGSWRSDTAKSSGLLILKSTRASISGTDYFRASVELGIQVAEALQHAHDNGIIHRDIKPSNLMLDIQGNIWVTDFGLAQIQGDVSITSTGDIVGTLRYLSPEQVLAKRVVVDSRTDIYSLGATLYELLTLKLVCDGKSREEVISQIAFEEPVPPRKVNRLIPIELDTIVTKSLAKNPSERYQSAQELADDLRRYQADEPIRARRPTIVQRVNKWGRRHRGIVGSAAGLVVIALFAWAVSYWQVLLAYGAEKEARLQSDRLVMQFDALRLAALSMLERPKNPGLALSLALIGRRGFESVETNTALLEALDENYELKTLRGHSTPVGNASFSPDGRLAASAAMRTEYGTSVEPARVWVAETGKLHCLIQGVRAITSAAFSPAGGRLLAAASPVNAERIEGETEEIVGIPPSLFDVTTGGKLVELKDAFLFEANPTCFSPSGQQVVAPARGNKARIYDVVEGFGQRDLVGHTDRVQFAAFSPKGKFVVTISRDRTVRIWDAPSGNELLRLSEWKKQLPTNAIFSPDERFLATASLESVDLWDTVTGKRLNTDHWGGNSVKFSPEGAILFVANNHEVRAYDVITRKRLYEIKDFLGQIRALEVSPLGDFLAIASGTTIELWSATEGNRQAILRGHGLEVRAVAFAFSGQKLISGAMDKTARIWSVQSGAQRSAYGVEPSTTPNQLLAFSSAGAFGPNSTRMAVASQSTEHTYVFDPVSDLTMADFAGRFEEHALAGERTITVNKNDAIVWDHAQRTKLLSFHSGSIDIYMAALAPDGQQAVIVRADGMVWTWNLRDDTRQELISHPDRVADAAFSRNGEYVATACGDGKVRLWEVKTGRLLQTLQVPGAAMQVRFYPQSDRLLAVSSRNTLHVWKLPTGEKLFEIADQAIKLSRAYLSAEGEFIITYQEEEGVVCWQGSDGKFARRFEEPRGWLRITLSESQPKLLVASEQTGLYSWNFETGQSRHVSKIGTVHATFAPGGRQIVSATSALNLRPEYSPKDLTTNNVTPRLQIWDSESGDLVRSILTPLGAVSRMEFAPNGELLITAVRFGASILDVENRGRIADIDGHAASISAMVFEPQGKLIATASWDHTAALWDASTAKLVRWLDGHQAAVTALAFHPQGNELATASADGVILVWNVATGERLRELRGHTDLIFEMHYAPGGDRLLTSSRDGTFSVWNPAGQKRSIASPSGVFLSADFSRKGDILALPGGQQIPTRGNPSSRSVGLSEQEAQTAPRPYVAYLYRSLELTPALLIHDAAPRTGTFNHDGTRAATVDSAGTVYVWNIQDVPERLLKLDESQSPDMFAWFSPDNRRLVTRSPDNMSLWDIASGLKLATYPEARGAVVARTSRLNPDANPLTPDGKWLISIIRDKQYYLRRRPVDILSFAEPFAPAELSREEKMSFRIRD